MKGFSMKQIISSVSILLLVGLGVGIGIMRSSDSKAIDKANHLKDEGNAAKVGAAKAIEGVQPKFASLYTDEALAAFPKNRAEMEATAKETVDTYAKAAEQFRLAAAKFDEASRQDIDISVAEYFSAWSQASAKSAERAEAVREFVGLWLDTQVDSREKLDARSVPLNTRLNEINSAIAELEAKAEKIQTDNAAKFE
jgi:hypothetical protein